MILFSVVVGLSLGVGLWLVVVPAMPLESRPQRPPSRVWQPVAGLLTEAGLAHLNPWSVVGVVVFGATAVGFVVTLLFPVLVLGPLAAIATALLAYAFVLRERGARRHRLRVAWPGVIDHIRAGIRSGSDVVRAVAALPPSLPPDIATTVGLFRDDLARGMSSDMALGQWGARLADPVGDRIVEVLRMAGEVGGTDLPDVLNSLQRSVRHDIAVREDATAKQSWVRSAAVMAVAAPWVVLVVIGSRGDTLQSYQSLEGSIVLVVGAVVSALAYRMMHAIGSLPPQRRWVN
ncbi:MAG: type II secretion system F family protein [Pontimonas sp.]|nr:type II secretion system F family protein [Pontimonas sp.]